MASTVGPSKDYASLNAWEAAKNGVLSAPEEAECYNFEDSTAVTFAGWTTTAANYIRVYAAAGNKHDGKWSESGYRLTSSNTTATVYIDNDARLDYRFEDIQIENSSTNATATAGGMRNYESGGEIYLKRCIFKGNPASSTTGTHCGLEFNNFGDYGDGLIVVVNCLSYDWTGSLGYGFMVYERQDGEAIVYNCTACHNSYVNIAVGGGEGSTEIVRCKNCICQGQASHADWDEIDNAATEDYDQIITEDSSSPTGEGSTAVYFADEDNDDFHLHANDTAARGNGTDLSSDPDYDFTDDIDGDTRSAWDIGADEYSAGAGDPDLMNLTGYGLSGGFQELRGGFG